MKSAQTYYYYNGHFKYVGGKWLEYQPNTKIEFNEVGRTRDYITLLNKTPRSNPRWESMLVRLPVCGGTAQWTYENPEQWTDLYQVYTHPSSEIVARQAKFEQ
jgi:hypothetical protein